MQSNLQLTTTMAAPVVHRVVNQHTRHDSRSLSRADSSGSTALDKTQQKVDFIGSSKAVKHLFSLPYTQDQNVSVALHNMGNGTILLDSAEDFEQQQSIRSGRNNISSPNNRNMRTSGSGRRRQRPRSWSIEEHSANEQQTLSEEEELRLEQLRKEEERSLLTSLSLLLEEEQTQQKQLQLLQNQDDSSALVVPSNAIVLKKEEIDTIPIVKPIGTPVTNSAMNQNNDCDPDDILSANLKPPQHYLSHVVQQPTEPRQYVNWQFQDMNLMVASDAVIYKQSSSDQNTDESGVANSGESITLRVVDVSELRSGMEGDDNTVSEDDGKETIVPSSYAEALLLPPSEIKEEEGSCTEEAKNKTNDAKLQTCIVPASNLSPDLAEMGFSMSSAPPIDVTTDARDGSGNITSQLSPVCTVLDTYLDNLMANVPQLALLLQEKGFIQNIKLLQTDDIPTLMMHPSTLGVETTQTRATNQQTFSPELIEMNAAMLLSFLKTNCSRENSTYLLHRTAGETNIQLFDISSISQMRQRKWVWWLALCSYRFACRLEQLQNKVLSPHDKVTRREYRERQRNLLNNTLNLLEDLADMDGGHHETIAAAVCEHLADTFLWSDEAEGDVGPRDSSKPAPWASSSQPYRKVTPDCLNKAHDHLMSGIKKLTPLLTKAREKESPIEIEALSTQLYGIHHKMINVCLKLADIHLQNYFSSNLLQSLRMAARMLRDATSLVEPLGIFDFSQDSNDDSRLYGKSILLQYAWLWEFCGHFARSYAADSLWRERGHISGTDLLSLFREVDSACNGITKLCFRKSKWRPKTSVSIASHGQVSLQSLSGIVVLPDDFEEIEASVLQKEGCHEAISTSKSILQQQTQIKRDNRLVLVAASVCYSHAIDSYLFLAEKNNDDVNDGQGSVEVDQPIHLASTKQNEPVAPLLRQRLGDASNEIGKILLAESRAVLLKQNNPDSSKNMSHVSAIMLASAQFWFAQGLEQFTAGKDLRNVALLRCNLCQCCKIRANTNVILPGSSKDQDKKSNAEIFLQKAVDHLVLAHEAMGERDADSLTWDMVSEELAATLLVLGVRRRQSSLASSNSSQPLFLQGLRLTPGAEKAIVEPMERSCKIYESLGTAHARHQAAAAHYQLAMYFSKVWTCQRDETKTRDKLSLSFKHFGLAHQYFFLHAEGNEPTFIVLSLDFSNLYAAVSGEECLSKALGISLDTREAFSSSALSAAHERLKNVPDFQDWLKNMNTLSENVESRVMKLLLSLTKIEKDNNSKLKKESDHSEKYKNMYREVLTHKMKSKLDTPAESKTESEFPSSFPIYELLQKLSDLLQI
ncbi:hypothetical protein ACHAWC_008163 [Mediolabrus comicus]